MRIPMSIWLLGALALAGVLGTGLALSACPLSHDAYETDRPCWNDSDCVGDELCGKLDACVVGSCPTPENTTGECAVPSDGPCGPLDAGVDGYWCFPSEDGVARSCYYNPQQTCIECALDGGLPRDCPPSSCLTWRGRYGCQ